MSEVVGRRDVLRLLGLGGALALGGITLLNVPGCGTFEAESGAAFEPWAFPGAEARPAWIAARAALLAASPHNTQPWALRIAEARIELFARLDRNLGAMDCLRRELHVGLGCALENLAVAARASGLEPRVTLIPENDESLVARVELEPAAASEAELFDAIARRHTNRGAYLEAAAAPGLERALRATMQDARIEMHWIDGAAARARFREQTILATKAIVADREMAVDGERWYRHSEAEIRAHRDGTTLDATGNGAFVRKAGKAQGRPSLETSNDYWLSATEQRQTTGTAFVILSSSPASSREEQLLAGRAYQRMHLWAVSQGLAMQPLNQLAERQDREELLGLAPRFGAVLADAMGAADRRAQMLFRIGYAKDDALQSPRRPLEWVLA